VHAPDVSWLTGSFEGSILRANSIEIHLAESKQLFNAIDPAPFREKDLDPKAEEFIVDWPGSSPPVLH
jgi:hypothetical protein